jgi:hypothetical protein
MRRVLVLATFLLAAASLAAADSDVVDHVSVRKVGGTVTRAFSPKLFVGVRGLDYWTKVDFDGRSGHWTGPKYYKLAGPSPNGDGITKMSWRVGFAHATARAAIDAQLTNHWPVDEQSEVNIERVPIGQLETTRPGTLVLTKNPARDAVQYEGAVGFPLCRGVAAVVDFEASDPATAHAPNGSPYIVRTPTGDHTAGEWNREEVLAALKQVDLDGYLPPGRIQASVRHRVIAGRVWDCAGEPMFDLRLKIGRRRVSADGFGRFRLRVKRSGRYRIVASVAGQTKAKTVRVR